MTTVAAAWLESCQQHITAARDFYPEKTLEQAERDFRQATDTILAAGLTISLDKSDRPVKVEIGAAKASVSPSIIDIVKKRPSYPPAWYRISSGASHTLSWMVQQAAALDVDGAHLQATADQTGAATIAVLGSFEDVTQTFGDYHGHARTHEAVRTVQRRTIAVTDLINKWRAQMERDARSV
jgi:hypothetical protein